MKWAIFFLIWGVKKKKGHHDVEQVDDESKNSHPGEGMVGQIQ